MKKELLRIQSILISNVTQQIDKMGFFLSFFLNTNQHIILIIFMINIDFVLTSHTIRPQFNIYKNVEKETKMFPYVEKESREERKIYTKVHK